MICKKCGKEIADDVEFCPECGAKIICEDMFSGINKIILVLIAIQLGSFGIHNFVLGETKKGIVKIVLTCFCGIGFILALIDVVKIAKGTYKVDPEAFI